MITLSAQALTKDFGGPPLFQNLTFAAQQGECLALTGPNGSGKSTLLQILWGFQRPTAGSAVLLRNHVPLSRDERPFLTAFSAPYMGLPDYLPGQAVLRFHFAKRQALATVPNMLEELGLAAVADQPVRQYSSGQRQRLRLALALYADAPALFLDEPCTNLDDAGIALYKSLLHRRLPHALVVIASNWSLEMEAAQRQIRVA